MSTRSKEHGMCFSLSLGYFAEEIPGVEVSAGSKCHIGLNLVKEKWVYQILQYGIDPYFYEWWQSWRAKRRARKRLYMLYMLYLTECLSETYPSHYTIGKLYYQGNSNLRVRIQGKQVPVALMALHRPKGSSLSRKRALAFLLSQLLETDFCQKG